jgi:hypothetical protein
LYDDLQKKEFELTLDHGFWIVLPLLYFVLEIKGNFPQQGLVKKQETSISEPNLIKKVIRKVGRIPKRLNFPSAIQLAECKTRYKSGASYLMVSERRYRKRKATEKRRIRTLCD